jgi:Raf kinase inhibitor-like YbhB/YbcL family protein
MGIHRRPAVLAQALLLVCAGVVTTGCQKDGEAPFDAASAGTAPGDPLQVGHVPSSTLRLTSSAFKPNGPLADEYTCHGSNVSPPLSLSGVPRGARSLVLVVDDPDAPDPAAPTKDWIHWIVFNLAPTTTNLPQAATSLPAPAAAGMNDWGRPDYGGPCPPKGRHRYFFWLYALDEALELTTPTVGDLRAAVQGHVLASTSLMGTCEAK